MTVERTGDTYRVTWDIGGQTFVGTGIGSDNGFAVSYRSGSQTGLAIYGANGDNWEGVWTFSRRPGRSAARPGPADKAGAASVGFLTCGSAGP